MKPTRGSKAMATPWLTLAVVLPLILLTALAVRGVKVREKEAWEAKEIEAGRAAEVAAEAIGRELSREVRRFVRFPEPPVPGLSSPLDEVLDGGDLQALERLRDSEEAGLSPAGLPRRVLAALRLVELDPERLGRAEECEKLLRLVTEECPSVLSERAMEKAELKALPEARRWEEIRSANRLLRERPEGGWFQEGDSFRWVRPEGDAVAYLPEVEVSRGVFRFESAGGTPGMRLAAPVGFSIRLSTKSGAEETALFAVAPVPFAEGLRVEVTLDDPTRITREIRGQQRWTFSLLAVASCVSLGGLFFLQRALRRERQLHEMKSQFVASVSHELRAPVASIRLMADALEAGKVAPETAKEFHRLIAREGARLSTLVGNVLDHARIEQGRRMWKMEWCDLAELTADTARVMEPLAKEKAIGLRCELAAVEARVDADAIQQALVNLIDNAIKFSSPGTAVTIGLAAADEGRRWRLSVQDEGPGIPREEQSRIFERFYRPGDELRRETQGTGIGLSLVKAIAEAHGGRVTVESEPGRGSTFILCASHETAGD